MPGLWDWQAPHPGWEAGQPWGPVVSSHALRSGDHLLLFDPLDVPAELAERATLQAEKIALWKERTRSARCPGGKSERAYWRRLQGL